MWMFVESLLILHNILQSISDDPFEIDRFNGKEEEDLAPPDEQESVLVQAARGWNQMSEDVLYQIWIARWKALLHLYLEP